jgi:hypothetical protein
VVVGSVCPLPPLSSGGAQVTLPWLRFHIPLIEPDWRISRIRLSDRTSRLHPRRTASKLCEAHESEVPVQVRGWKASTPPSPRLVLVTEPPTQPRSGSRAVRRSSTRLMFASCATTSPSLMCTGSCWAMPEHRTHGGGCSCLCSPGRVARG